MDKLNPDQISDQDLVTLLCGQEKQVSQGLKFIDNCFKPGILLCLRQRYSAELSEDFFQEGLLKFLESIKANYWQQKGSLKAYLRKICIRKAIDYYRCNRSVIRIDMELLSARPSLEDEDFIEMPEPENKQQWWIDLLLNHIGLQGTLVLMLWANGSDNESIYEYIAAKVGYSNATTAKSARYKYMQKMIKAIQKDCIK